MRIEQIIKLATKAAEGSDNLKEGAVGSNGYGFVFKDFDTHQNEPFIVPYGSSKFCGAGVHRDFIKNLRKYKNVDVVSDLFRNDIEPDLLLAGSLRTLVPSLQFGGIETLFEIWMFVKTPKDQMFPATFYWGQSGLSVGGWASYGVTPFVKEKVFPENFLEAINFSPFEFTDDERGCFLDALEFALKKVPVSDFWGVYNHDLGNSYMGVRRGESFIKELGYFERNLEAEKEVEPLLEREFKDVYKESFVIRLLPMRIYVVQFESDVKQDDTIFGNAKKVLGFWKSQKSISYKNTIRQKTLKERKKRLMEIRRGFQDQ